MATLNTYLHDFLSLFIPEICTTCGDKLVISEKYICLKCLYDLPRTNFHKEDNNPVELLFWGRAKIEKATSWFYFRKGSRYQSLMHFLKYKGLKELGEVLGESFASEVNKSNYFKEIDVIVPVPLHKKKKKKRGYNQSEWIAKGMAKILNVPVSSENLVRMKYTNTQTRKSRFERWENVEDIFQVLEPGSLEGQHILLVDDVVTTGSTLEACAFSLLKHKNIKVSIATLASSII